MTGYGQFCSIARAHEVLGGRWTLLIVREILCGSRRFNDIRRGILRVSRTVLSERLHALVFAGAVGEEPMSLQSVSRTVLSERLHALVFAGAVARIDGPHGPGYSLTEAGQELAALIARHLGSAVVDARGLE